MVILYAKSASTGGLGYRPSVFPTCALSDLLVYATYGCPVPGEIIPVVAHLKPLLSTTISHPPEHLAHQTAEKGLAFAA